MDFLDCNEITKLVPGSWADLTTYSEVKDLKASMDFRKPEYRREVFLRFYEFHCKYKSHPGAVYYAFPWLFEKFSMTTEQKLWFCFINGLSQNVITTFRLWQKCKEPNSEEDLESMFNYFRDNYLKFGWDTDRRYVKNKFEDAVSHYIYILHGRSQEEFFKRLTVEGNEFATFDVIWQTVMRDFYLFGRLSTFSYLEYLRIAGLPLQCNDLFLEDIDGSKSHRNGLCKVLGRDDLDWTKDNEVKYPFEMLNWLRHESWLLYDEAAERMGKENVSLFTLESTLCCYKSWFRKNRRYPNCYNDMFYERIKRDERLWGVDDVNKMFRQLRKECLPVELRVEDNPNDPGLVAVKQNHFRLTGEVLMMDLDWACFKNNFKQYKNELF